MSAQHDRVLFNSCEVPTLKTLTLYDEYRIRITGLGEIYETMSCRLLMEQLRRKFPGHYVVAFVSKREATPQVLRAISANPNLVSSGLVDIPPWRSGYRPLKSDRLLKLSFLASPVLMMLASLERWYPNAIKARRAHMVWFLNSC
jgi:hypothetical protein